MTQEEKLFAKLDLCIKSILKTNGIKNVSSEDLRKCSLEWLTTSIKEVDIISESFENDIYENDTISKILSKYNPEEFGE
jgi:hypothetical protein